MKQKTLFAAFLLLFCATSLWASTTSIDGVWYDFNTTSMTATVTYRGSSPSSYSNEYSGSVVIPESVTYNGKTYSVTGIRDYAFSECRNLTLITIPNSVINIGERAFWGCSGLTSVNLGNGITSIGNIAFYGCNISSINFSGTIEDWCNKAWSPLSVSGGYQLLLNGIVQEYVTIPNSVTSIRDYSFYGCNSLSSVVIGNSVTSIGKWAFRDCSGLTSIKISNSVTCIGDWAFVGCSSLISVSIGNNVNSIGDLAFCGCSSMTSVTIPNSVTSIGSSAFSGCSSMTSVTIPNSVTSIGSSAFSGCSNMTSVTIGSSVTSIGDNAFSGCTSLTSIIWNAKNCNSYNFGSQITSFTFGYGVEHIPAYLCRRMDKLTSITIPQSVKDIGEYAFDGCKIKSINFIGTIEDWCNKAWSPSSISAEYQLLLNGELQENVTIPNSVTSVGENTFFGCSSLISVTIGNSVTSIGGGAFCNCSSLISVTIPNSVTSIGSGAFYGCIISSINFSGTIEDWCNKTWSPSNVAGGYQLLLNGVLQENVTIPNSVTGICNYAFQNCSSLTSVSIPNSVISIGWSAFSGCSNMTTVSLNSDTFVSKDYSSSEGGLMKIFGSQVTKYILGDEITRIGDYAFLSCSSLTSVTIGQSVTSIGERAFYNCNRLTSVTIGNSVTNIGNYAFYGCSSLTSVAIPNSVTSIGNYAFSGWSGLTSVTIGNSVTSIGDNAFSYCTLLKSLTIPNNVISIGYSAFSDCYSLTSVTIGNSITSIAYSAFSSCSSLKSIEIPNSVTSIGNEAFRDCISLTSVTIPNSVTSIGDRAFYDCTGMTSVTIGNSVTSIGEGAFMNCSSLTSITIPNSVTNIGSRTFIGCSSLKSITIGKSVTSIGYYAFDACNNLTDIFVPCGYLEYYKRLLSNDERVKNKTLAYTVDVITIGEGAVSGADCIDGDADDTIAELLAIPDPYSRFAGWSDGNTDNPRTIILTQDTVMRAIFEYILTDKCGKDNALTWTLDTTNFALSITGKGELTENYSYGNFIKSVNIGKGVYVIGATAFRDFKNITAITLSNSVTNIGMEAFSGCSSLASVTIPNSVTSIGNHAFYGCSGLTSVIIPEGCDSICDGAFSNCGNITSVTVPSTLTYVGAYAFNTQKILDVYNYATTPQDMSLNNYYSGLELTMLRGILASARLHVPQQSIELYSNTYFWCYFGHILPIQSTTVETNCVNVSATETTATVVWPQVNNATTYELVIIDKNGNVVCTLVFDGEGKLLSIAFGGPARDNSTEQVQAVGFEFTVTGLESGTSYNLTITAKDNNGNALNVQTTSFVTEGNSQTEITNVVDATVEPTKVIRNGQLFILRGDKTYTVQGQEVR